METSKPSEEEPVLIPPEDEDTQDDTQDDQEDTQGDTLYEVEVPESEPEAPTPTRKGRRFASDKPTISEIRRLKKPNTRKCAILLDSSLAHEIGELEYEIEQLEKGKDTQRRSLADSTDQNIEKLVKDLETLHEEAEDLTVVFTFQDIGRRKYDKLVTDHLPTDEEKKTYKDAGGEGVLGYSTDTFPPALVHATAIEPKFTIEEATEIFHEWAEGDIELLFTTALLVCKEPTSLPKSKAGIAKMRDSQRNSTIAPNLESPTPSS